MTHPKNNDYVRKWRQNNELLNRQKCCAYSKKYAAFKRQQRILLNIDPTLFL